MPLLAMLISGLVASLAHAGTTCAPDSALGCITVDDFRLHGDEGSQREPVSREPVCDAACQQDRYERQMKALLKMEHIRPPEPVIGGPDLAREAFEDLDKGYTLLANALLPTIAWPPAPEFVHPPPRPRDDPESSPNRDTGKCTETQHAALQTEVDKECKQEEQRCRGPRNDELNDCDALRALLSKNRAGLRQKQRCLRARQKMRNQCFPAPRPEIPGDEEKWKGHRDQSAGILNGIKDCKRLIELVEARPEKAGCK